MDYVLMVSCSLNSQKFACSPAVIKITLWVSFNVCKNIIQLRDVGASIRPGLRITNSADEYLLNSQTLYICFVLLINTKAGISGLHTQHGHNQHYRHPNMSANRFWKLKKKEQINQRQCKTLTAELQRKYEVDINQHNTENSPNTC